MAKKFVINTSGVQDRVKQTLSSASIPIYDWMFDTGLHQADLLVYAAFFDILRREPLTPQRINLSDVGKRIRYSRQSVYGAMQLLTEHNFIFRQGDGRDSLFSLYPFDTLDLK